MGVMAIQGINVKDYTIDDLLQLCVHNGLSIEYSTNQSVMRMRCIVALRNAGVIKNTAEHVVTREIHFREGSKHRITGSQGMDYPTGIIEVVWVGEPDDSVRESEDYRVLCPETDPSLSDAVWIAFKYLRPRSAVDEQGGILYCPADLLAEHIACW